MRGQYITKVVTRFDPELVGVDYPYITPTIDGIEKTRCPRYVQGWQGVAPPWPASSTRVIGLFVLSRKNFGIFGLKHGQNTPKHARECAISAWCLAGETLKGAQGISAEYKPSLGLQASGASGECQCRVQGMTCFPTFSAPETSHQVSV